MKNKMKEKRKEEKITQEQLARKVDITLNQIQNIENNRSTPKVDIAIKISRILKSTVEEIFIID